MRHDPLRHERRSSDRHPPRVAATNLRGFYMSPRDVFPSARMKRTSDQNITTGGIGVKVTFDTRDKDTDYEDGGQQTENAMCDLTNDYMLVKRDGWWRLWAKLPFKDVAAAGGRTGYMQIDTGGGFATLVGSHVTVLAASGQAIIIPLYIEHQLSRGDKIELWAAQTSGLTVALDNTLGIMFGASWQGL